MPFGERNGFRGGLNLRKRGQAMQLLKFQGSLQHIKHRRAGTDVT